MSALKRCRGRGAVIEPQAGLANRVVGPVTLKAFGGQNGTHLAEIVGAACFVGDCGARDRDEQAEGGKRSRSR